MNGAVDTGNRHIKIVIRVLACDLRHMERQKNPGQHGDGNGHAVISDLDAEDEKLFPHDRGRCPGVEK